MLVRRLLLLLVLCAVHASAQELDVFDVNDFVDPRVRGAVFDRSGFGMSQPGAPFSLVRAYGGRVSDYLWRNEPTDIDLTFLHLAGTFYRSNKQLNVKFTSFDADEGWEQLPKWRAVVQGGWYFTTQERHSDGADGDERVSGRVLLTYALEDSKVSSSDAERHARAQEYGAEIDAFVRIGRIPFMGSLIWMRRFNDGRGSHRITYVYRPPQLNWRRLHLTANLGAGVEKTDAWHYGLLRGVFNAGVDLPLGLTFNASYSPSYLPGGAERRTYHEVALYVDRKVFSHLGQ